MTGKQTHDIRLIRPDQAALDAADEVNIKALDVLSWLYHQITGTDDEQWNVQAKDQLVGLYDNIQNLQNIIRVTHAVASSLHEAALELRIQRDLAHVHLDTERHNRVALVERDFVDKMVDQLGLDRDEAQAFFDVLMARGTLEPSQYTLNRIAELAQEVKEELDDLR